MDESIDRPIVGIHQKAPSQDSAISSTMSSSSAGHNRQIMDFTSEPTLVTNEPFTHITTLSEIVKALEGLRQSKTQVLDELIRVNRTCLNRTKTVMSRDECKACTSSGMMIMSISDLILAHFETMVQVLGLDVPQEQSVESEPPVGLPAIRFGILELDSDDQAEIARCILLKDLQHFRQVFQSFPSFFQGVPTRHSQNIFREWCTVLKSRLEHLDSVTSR